MAKAKAGRTGFFCSACGNEQPRWFGRCPACGAWNSAAEAPSKQSVAPSRKAGGARAGWTPGGAARPGPRPLAEVETTEASRITTGIRELDRTLGGGLPPGALLLVGGDPGIGKSTLLLQAAMALAGPERTILLVTGEESDEQVRLRASRLGAIPDRLMILCETDLEAILEAAAALRPAAMIVDSIQTVARADLEGGPGSVTQVRECGLALLHFAKTSRTSVLLVGHVTKDGAVAGPRVLEHMVDAVLYLEGERYQHFRVLRAAKNRFGSTNEIGVFEMTDRGLAEVQNPSRAFLAASGGAHPRAEPGAAVVASLEGTRPLLVEVQALVSTSFYGTPQRVTNGFDGRRLAVLLAVLERRAGLRLGRHDVFVSVAGGLSLEEPGTDLGVALAIASSAKNRPLRPRTAVAGEVALSGELRRIARADARAREAAQLGFARFGMPAAQAGEVTGLAIEIAPLAGLAEAFEVLLGARVPAPEADPDEAEVGPAGATALGSAGASRRSRD